MKLIDLLSEKLDRDIVSRKIGHWPGEPEEAFYDFGYDPKKSRIWRYKGKRGETAAIGKVPGRFMSVTIVDNKKLAELRSFYTFEETETKLKEKGFKLVKQIP